MMDDQFSQRFMRKLDLFGPLLLLLLSMCSSQPMANRLLTLTDTLLGDGPYEDTGIASEVRIMLQGSE